MPDPNWYIVHTYSGYEERVRETLQQRADALGMSDHILEIRIPTEEIVEKLGGQTVRSQRKFFPGYVLVRMVMTDNSWAVVKNTPKVTGFVGTGKKPTPLTDEEVAHILDQVRTKSEPESAESYAVGETVRVNEGPFKGFEGVVEQVDGSKLRVAISIYGRVTPVDLDGWMLAKAG